MKLAIMQPYLFPYIGYFQLLNLVDTFIIYDDVQFIKGGWINRNNLLISGKKKLFGFSLKKSSTFSNICDREFDIYKFEKEKSKLLKSIQQSYVKAPLYYEVYDLVKRIFDKKDINVVDFIESSLVIIMDYLGVKTQLIRSSNIDFNKELKSQERVLELCNKLDATNYINPIGGIKLYHKKDFLDKNIELSFIETSDIEYKQFSDDFIPFLSIVDIMMFNTVDEISSLLNKYELV